MAKKPIMRKITQGQHWHRLYLLLNTSNYIDDPQVRKMMAKHDDESGLSESCIAEKNLVNYNWTTKWLELNKLRTLFLEECMVGKNRTPFIDCLNVLISQLKPTGACTCQLHKNRSHVILTLRGIKGKELKLVDYLRTDDSFIASGAEVADFTADLLRIEWEITISEADPD